MVDKRSIWETYPKIHAEQQTSKPIGAKDYDVQAGSQGRVSRMESHSTQRLRLASESGFVPDQGSGSQVAMFTTATTHTPR